MKKNRLCYECDSHSLTKTFRIMRITIFLLLASIIQTFANDTYSQKTRLSLDFPETKLVDVLDEIESKTEFFILFNEKLIDTDRMVEMSVKNEKIDEVLDQLFERTDVVYTIIDRKIILAPSFLSENEQQQKSVSGKVTDESGDPLPGVTVVIKGTVNGTITDMNGNYSISNVPENATLQFSFIGMETQGIIVGSQTIIDIILSSGAIGLEEVVAIGYGSMRKSDLTGSASRANIETFRDMPNASILQSLHGSVAGMNVSQITQAGQESDIMVRGRTSLSGTQNPLIILDGVIFRGNIIDINPSDIESVDVLKDISAAAIYGSQAANGVVLITTKKGKTRSQKPMFNYSSSYSVRTPAFELTPQSPEEFNRKNTVADLYNGRTSESGYLEENPNYDITNSFKSSDLAENYRTGNTTNWYDLVTNDNIYQHNQSISLTSNTDYLNYFISLGYMDEQGYMLNEGFKRYNARINIDNQITPWFSVGIQAFYALSDYSGQDINPERRYIGPYDAAYSEDGDLIKLIESGKAENPLVVAKSDNLDVRNNLFGNIYADIDLSFITEGLSYKINFSNNYRTERDYFFQPYARNFQGEGGKSYSNNHDMSSDNILTYKRIFNDNHNLNVTLVYGFEERKNEYTNSMASIFIDPTLGYNNLQSGSADQREIITGAWQERSLYNMGRFFYGYQDKYLITGTVRRDGFSGFSENNKWGIFPSVALAWVPTKETFFPENNIVNYLKLRLTYGSIGNRTLGRYQTLAKVSGGFNYVDSAGTPLYGKEISDLASPNLRWETTTGINLGLDFGLIKSKLNGSIEYYSNNTTDLLYNVDIPSISRYSKFPDNLGKLHNHGIEINLSSINFQTQNFSWKTDFVFSRNRDELKELLGFDLDGDGKEDDLISEELFIGQPLNSIYHYETTGKLYQFGDDIPSYSDVGMYEVVDQNEDGKLDSQNDYKILGYNDPSYRFSISNTFNYKNWSLFAFINSIQGGKDYYYGLDVLMDEHISGGFNRLVEGEQPLEYSFPKYELAPYWRPENPDAIYQRIKGSLVSGQLAQRWTQRNFIRLQDVSLSYNFDSHLLKRISISNLRLYLSGKNLFTLTKWRGWDPETGEAITRNGRPVLRSYTFGINVNF